MTPWHGPTPSRVTCPRFAEPDENPSLLCGRQLAPDFSGKRRFCNAYEETCETCDFTACPACDHWPSLEDELICPECFAKRVKATEERLAKIVELTHSPSLQSLPMGAIDVVDEIRECARGAA